MRENVVKVSDILAGAIWVCLLLMFPKIMLLSYKAAPFLAIVWAVQTF